MTALVGYLVMDRIDYHSVFQERFWFDFSPYGAFAPISWWPEEDDSPSQKSEFIEEAMSVYDRLRRKGCQDIVMAMTLLSEAFDGYELKYLDKETSPTSFEDWIALAEVYDENEIRDKVFSDRYAIPGGDLSRKAAIRHAMKEMKRVEKSRKQLGKLEKFKIREIAEIDPEGWFTSAAEVLRKLEKKGTALIKPDFKRHKAQYKAIMSDGMDKLQKRVDEEREIRDRDFRESHKSQEGRTMGFIRGKNDSAEIEMKGVLAVARIRSDVEDASKDRAEP